MNIEARSSAYLTRHVDRKIGRIARSLHIHFEAADESSLEEDVWNSGFLSATKRRNIRQYSLT